MTGKLLDVGSRLQTYFCARFFRNEEPIIKSKKGAVILVGGGDGHIDKAYSTACTLLHHMNCSNIHEVVYSHNTNTRPAINDKNTLMDLALEKAELQPDEVWYIGDQYECDVKGSLNAGLLPVWYIGAIDLPYAEDKNILTAKTWSEIKRYMEVSVCREQKMSN